MGASTFMVGKAWQCGLLASRQALEVRGDRGLRARVPPWHTWHLCTRHSGLCRASESGYGVLVQGPGLSKWGALLGLFLGLEPCSPAILAKILLLASPFLYCIPSFVLFSPCPANEASARANKLRCRERLSHLPHDSTDELAVIPT